MTGKRLTLQDVGIPDYSRESYMALPHLEQIAAYHIIGENGLTVDSPITNSKISALKWRFGLDETRSGLMIVRFLERETPTYREFSQFLEEQAKSETGVFEPLIDILFPMGPYFTNNFTAYFANSPNPLYRRYAEEGIETMKKVQDALDALVEEHPFDWPHSQEWEPHKTIHPYFITLRRQGFSEHDLTG